jgi:hypothetical protein
MLPFVHHFKGELKKIAKKMRYCKRIREKKKKKRGVGT